MEKTPTSLQLLRAEADILILGYRKHAVAQTKKTATYIIRVKSTHYIRVP